jgi:hypothetical protein
MKKHFRLILLVIIGFMLSFILSPIIDFLSGLIGFGMGIAIGYLFLCFAESKWGWFKDKK